MNRNYRKGYHFEHYVVTPHLRARGYFVVESRGSHGIVDVVAVRRQNGKEIEHWPLMIQCKNDQKGGYVDPQEMESLKLCSKKYQGLFCVAFRDKATRKLKFRGLSGEIISDGYFDLIDNK